MRALGLLTRSQPAQKGNERERERVREGERERGASPQRRAGSLENISSVTWKHGGMERWKGRAQDLNSAEHER